MVPYCRMACESFRQSEDCKRGRRKGATSKIVKKCQNVFRQFSRRAKNVKNRQKVSKSFSTLFDNFRAAPFFRPLLQSAEARKRHININFLVRLLLGHPGNVPGTNQVCPRDKVGLSQGQTQVFLLFYTAEAQFVPGTNPVVPGTFRGRRAADRVYVLKVYVPFSFPRVDPVCERWRLAIGEFAHLSSPDVRHIEYKKMDCIMTLGPSYSPLKPRNIKVAQFFQK